MRCEQAHVKSLHDRIQGFHGWNRRSPIRSDPVASIWVPLAKVWWQPHAGAGLSPVSAHGRSHRALLHATGTVRGWAAAATRSPCWTTTFFLTDSAADSLHKTDGSNLVTEFFFFWYAYLDC
ncbi:hypothetical protein BDA96_02G108200 [Sorghum bicolor]|uniref:Uncharacterized protein n=2 Tax=Sorghum bicolor TaxID=4558 RepID=A0A921UUT3_SORBI|nr:hypothetical protein BDA96_02G108200 [Sorghum bicolor]KXG34880.1 hypothetical protein SORBI_3002G103200 [Sorghum bicolor]